MAPAHVAIVMDGNGRWAKARGHSRWFGHVRGASRVREVVRSARENGVRALTLFAFSTENWKRPDEEKSVLWKLLRRYLASEIEELEKNGVRLRIIGETSLLDPGLRDLLDQSVTRLSKNTGLQLTLAISYGSRREIADACKRFAEDCVSGKSAPSECSEETIEKYLWTSALGELSEVDLVIRTSGEKRTSNFLLWQAAYAEYVFVEKTWPDFKRADFEEAIRQYGGRERRFGAVSTKEKTA